MIEILATGALNTVQDLGREGYRDIGVSLSGAMDPLALRIGNLLLGNAQGCAALELQTFPVTLAFTTDGCISLTGADCRARLDGRLLPPWWALPVKAGQRLELGYPRSGARAYLGVRGGFDVPLVLGSRSTALRGHFGGLGGRPLHRGDRLASLPAPALSLPKEGLGVAPPEVALGGLFPRLDDGTLLLRAIPAGEHDLFEAVAEGFWNQTWKISAQSDRTGFRLSGTPLVAKRPMEMRSYGLMPGIVQVPPAGEPIIQLSDANTAGGYPKVAGVIEVDLWRLGQARIGSGIRLQPADTGVALDVEQGLDDYLSGLRRQLGRYVDLPLSA